MSFQLVILNFPLGIDVRYVKTRWPYRRLLWQDIEVYRSQIYLKTRDLFLAITCLSFPFILRNSAALFPFFHFLFISVSHTYTVKHTQGTWVWSSCPVSGQIFCWGGFSWALVYSQAQWASGDEGCGGGRGEDASCTNWRVFPPTSAQTARSVFIYGSCKITKVWNMLQHVYLIMRFIMTIVHRSQHCCGVVVWLNWWQWKRRWPVETFSMCAHLSFSGKHKRERTLIITLSIRNICPKWWCHWRLCQLISIGSYHSYKGDVFPWQPRGQKGHLWYNGPQTIITVVAIHWQGDIAWVVIIWCSENPSCSVSWDSLSLLTPHWPSVHCL